LNSSSSGRDMIVCIPGNPNIKAIQKKFDIIAGEGTIEVFGRMRDLERELVLSPVKALIVPGTFPEFNPSFSISMQGKLSGSSGQKYHIVAADSSVTSSNISSKKIAILDFIGTESLNNFFETYFGIMPKNLKRTNKLNDLLFLLGMESVDAIIVSSNELSQIKKKTKINLFTVIESKKQIPHPVFAIKDSDGAQYKAIIKKIPASLFKELGINEWEAK
jgi:hypothetical protein